MSEFEHELPANTPCVNVGELSKVRINEPAVAERWKAFNRKMRVEAVRYLDRPAQITTRKNSGKSTRLLNCQSSVVYEDQPENRPVARINE